MPYFQLDLHSVEILLKVKKEDIFDKKNFDQKSPVEMRQERQLVPLIVYEFVTMNTFNEINYISRKNLLILTIILYVSIILSQNILSFKNI